MNKKLEEYGDMKILEIMGVDGEAMTYSREAMRQFIMSIADGLDKAELKGTRKGFVLGIGCSIVAYRLHKMYESDVKGRKQVESK